MDSTQPGRSNLVGTAAKWGIGGLILWNLMTPEAKGDVRRWLSQLGSGLAAYQRQQAELERQRRIRELLSSLSFLKEPTTPLLQASPVTPAQPTTVPLTLSPAPSSSSLLAKQIIEPDAAWRGKVVHPSVVLILGKRGSGKSALAYRLLELLRYIGQSYVVGVPSSARNLIPDWIGIVATLEDLPPKSVALIDEAYLAYHARGSMTAASKAMSQALNLSRQREQTLLFVSQEARQVDKNIASSANVIVFKDLGMLQLEFDRPELTKLAIQAKEALDSVNGERRKWSFVYAPDADFQGLLENQLPSFWKPALSHLFAAEPSPSATRTPKQLTPQQKAQRARELRAQGASYGEIAKVLGVTRGTVLNYLKGYPYR